MDSFESLRRNRGNDLAQLNEAVKKLTSNEYQQDDRFWYPTLDKAGTGSGLIRFLPAPEGEDVPFIRYWYHSFKGVGGWYIENCLTSINKDDPVVEFNSELYKTSDDKNSPARKQVSAQKRKLTYVSNVYVIKDPEKPENNGKVKLFKYGATVFDQINKIMFPVQDELGESKPSINPFDMWEGANYYFRVHKEDGFTKYTKSEFGGKSEFLDSDTARRAVYTQLNKLQPFLAPESFKSYDELKKQLHKVLGLSGQTRQQTPQPAPKEEEAAAPREVPSVQPKGDVVEDEDVEAFFKNLGKR